jgi:hypothetical protein
MQLVRRCITAVDAHDCGYIYDSRDIRVPSNSVLTLPYDGDGLSVVLNDVTTDRDAGKVISELPNVAKVITGDAYFN